MNKKKIDKVCLPRSVQKITKEMTIEEIISKYPKAASFFRKFGFNCFGCPFAAKETIEQAIESRGINLKKFINKLNNKIR